MNYLQNLHTHSTYCDGKNTLEEMVIAAIEKGFDSIGFSGHATMIDYPVHATIPDYLKYWMTKEEIEIYKKEISQLKEKYKDRINILCGIEYEIFSTADIKGYDYVIGAVHHIPAKNDFVDVDFSTEFTKQVIDRYFEGDGMKYAKVYYEQMLKLADYPEIDIIAHFDLLTKFREQAHLFDDESKEYKNIALETLRELSKTGKFFEINTGAISRGYRTTPYPAPFILKEMNNLGCKIVITTDCHDGNFLDCCMKEAKEFAKECGFKDYYVLKENGFEAIKL